MKTFVKLPTVEKEVWVEVNSVAGVVALDDQTSSVLMTTGSHFKCRLPGTLVVKLLVKASGAEVVE